MRYCIQNKFRLSGSDELITNTIGPFSSKLAAEKFAISAQLPGEIVLHELWTPTEYISEFGGAMPHRLAYRKREG